MNKQETEEFVATAIGLAIARDSGSGGMVRLLTVTRDGVSRQLIKGDQLPLLPGDVAPGESGGMIID